VPLHVCNLSGRWPRKKKWDYWCITGPRFLFSATIAHIDYLSLGGIYFFEYDTGRFAEQGGVKVFSSEPHMPDIVYGDIRFEQQRLALSFRQTEAGVRIEIVSKSFGGKPLEAHLDIARSKQHETLNVVVPWNARTFQFTSKQHCLPTRGHILWGGDTFEFDPDTAFGCLDFGRGIWPYRTAWNWAAFSARCGEELVGLNMGAKWTDGTGANENGIVCNGRLYKIFEDIDFDYDDADFMKPWRMRTRASDVVDLVFTPFYDKRSAVNLGVICSKVHQCFGRYTGTLRVDGRVIRVVDALGWAEEQRARW
jgi:hypothetical protein